MGVHDVLHFDFMESPDRTGLVRCSSSIQHHDHSASTKDSLRTTSSLLCERSCARAVAWDLLVNPVVLEE
eukprot:6407911-Amphidinium_carterae.1